MQTGQLELKETKSIGFVSTLCLKCNKYSEVDVVENNHDIYLLIKIQNTKNQLDGAIFLRKMAQRKMRRITKQKSTNNR